ncbi:hypothetical protein QAD02_023370 [Eretmocerus hayati]|uniref:Uncharacterized protein n=1 Tax=Eretmocerus hayati TaxID=131215 RepID=A0ACC2PVL9_9HYME|nr:hypothetical protein QAD02_023370 [Eretmocerus hayati]
MSIALVPPHIHCNNFFLAMNRKSYVPVPPLSGLCYDYEKQKCVGGIARIAKIVHRLKEIRSNAVFLNSGDYFQGTLYYDLFRGNITAHFMNKLPHDAMTIGNHDFDDGISGLAAFLKGLKAKVVVSNINTDEEPSLQGLYSGSTIIHRGGRDIGVIGAIFNETNKISSTTEKVKFLDEVKSINLEAEKLKAKGVEIIIVLSHCGIEHDKIIASECPHVDVVVGGHSHILMYNGLPPSGEIAYSEYPLVVTQKKFPRKVLVVHAGAFTKYMGDIRIIFNEKSEVDYWKGNPIYLDSSIEEDPAISKDLQPWTTEMMKVGGVKVGEAAIFLNGSCSSGECNLANFVTDAMVDYYKKNSSIALTSAINVQNSIPIGPITFQDIYMTLPYNNTWDLIDLKGRDLIQVLEDNVSKNLRQGLFVNNFLLHWSGLKVVYNLSNTRSKLVQVQIRCHECPDGRYQDVDENKIYRIVVQSYLVGGKFKIIFEKFRNWVKGDTYDVENLVKYVQKVGTVNVTTESRMVFV